jgi:hypothetical protein
MFRPVLALTYEIRKKLQYHYIILLNMVLIESSIIALEVKNTVAATVFLNVKESAL